jgi:hypothetical protein
MKTRAKNKKETDHDQKSLANSTKELADIGSHFLMEFTECDGDVFYSTFVKLQAASFKYDNAKDALNMPKVGKYWDYNKGVTGEFKYRDIK